jgi:hypothetical protein
MKDIIWKVSQRHGLVLAALCCSISHSKALTSSSHLTVDFYER